MSVIVRVLFLLVVSSVSVIQSAPTESSRNCSCECLNSFNASAKIKSNFDTIDKVCCR